MIKSKKLSAIMASAVAVLLLISGTFAWQQTVKKTNEFVGYKNGDITLHDDFDPSIGKKEVYVENNGEKNLFVRIRLDEAMDLTSYNRTADFNTHTYISGFEDCKSTNTAGAEFHTYFEWQMGGSKWYMPSSGSQIVQNTTEYTQADEVNGAKETPYANLITAAGYLNLTDKASFIGWICDTDGYAYWSQPLAKGEVTGLLLRRVEVSPALFDTDYYYAIDVVVEAVDETDIPMWTTGAQSVDKSGQTYSTATEDGKLVLNALAALMQQPKQPATSPAAPAAPVFEATDQCESEI